MRKLPESLTLQGCAVVLRDWREADAPVLEAVCGDPDVCHFTTVPWNYSLAAARAWVRRQHERRTDGTAVALAIARRGSSHPRPRQSGWLQDGTQAALGYWLVPAARRHGLALMAARTLCEGGFRELGLARIRLDVVHDNAASRRLAERLGAVGDGLRLHNHEVNGRRWDMMSYTLVEPGLRACAEQ